MIEPMIRAGCPKEVCSKCGKAREPIYEKTGGLISAGGSPGSKTADEIKASPTSSIRTKTVQEKVLVGWTDCGCGAEFAPGIVLDPFMGAGTVALVAKKLGRNYLGIELNPEYIKMAERRISEVQRLLL